jgi:alpha-glucosidase
MESPMTLGTMYAIYEAAFQMVSDAPQSDQGQPAFQFLREVPAAWGETKVRNGTPGEFVTIARRRGKDRFLGAMTNWDARTLELPLDFLPSGNYLATIYADSDDADKNPTNVRVEKKTVTRSSRLQAKLAPGGGIAVRFTPVP